MNTDRHDDVCTCGHLRSGHLYPPVALDVLDDVNSSSAPLRCMYCTCKRFDRRNFSDAELEQRRREQFEDLKRKRAAEAAPEPTPAAPAAATLERIAVALERIAGELEVLTRPVRREHPCPRGGKHVLVWQPEGPGRCECGYTAGVADAG